MCVLHQAKTDYSTMFQKKWIKITSIVLGSVLAILFILSIIITSLINQKLPAIIAEKNDTPYHFTYDDLSFSLLNGSLALRDVEVSPKDSTMIKDSIDVTGKVKEIDIVGVNFIKLLTKKELAALKIKIIEPTVNLFESDGPKTKDTTQVKVGQSIDVNSLVIKGGQFNMLTSDGKHKVAKIQNINIDFDGIRFNERTVEKKIPFRFDKFEIKVDSMFFKLNDHQYMVSSQVKFNDKELLLKDYRLKPIHTQGKAYLPNTYDSDIFDIEAPQLLLNNTDWGFDQNDKLYFKADGLKFTAPNINIITAAKVNKAPKQKIKVNTKDAQLIDIKKFEIDNGKIKMWHPDASRAKFYIQNVQTVIEGIKLNELTRTSEIPIDYKTFKIKLDSMYYELNEMQYVRASHLNFTTKDFVLKDFKMKPLISNQQFVNNLTSSNTLLDIEAPILRLSNNEWGFNNQQFYFKTSAIKLDEVNVKLLNQKNERQVAQKAEAAAQKFLINFDLQIDTIRIKKSRFLAANKFDFNHVDVSLLGLKNKYGEQLNVNHLIINNPKFTLFGQPKRVAQRGSVKQEKSFHDIIKVKNTSIKNGVLQMVPFGSQKPNFTLKSFNLGFANLKVDPKTIKNSIPFVYDGVVLKSQGIDFDMNKYYQLNTSTLEFKNGNLIVNKLLLKPKLSRSAYVSQLKKEEDIYTVNVQQIKGNGIQWGIDQSKDFYLNASNMILDQMHANIYRSKVPADDISRKSMFSEKLRKMQFGLGVKQLNIVRSKLEYEEEGPNSNGAGKLTFSNINAVAKNVNSGYKKSSLPDVVLDWKSHFMGGDMYANWSFNPMNRNENFRIKGYIKNMPAKNMDPFLKPYLKVSAEGRFNEINFNFAGNNNNAGGDFTIRYNDLKVNILKDNGEKRKVLSALGNVLVSKNTKGNSKQAKVENIERDQQKSFFNFFLACILDGLKETILII